MAAWELGSPRKEPFVKLAILTIGIAGCFVREGGPPQQSERPNLAASRRERAS
jgi:hypothetical protein